MRPKQDEAATQEAGRPIFKMEEYVTIEIPADKSIIVDRPVREADRQEFSKQYGAFRADKDQDTASGTLLSATGLLPPERIEELAHFRIRTVEQLAAVSDSNIQALGLHSRTERQRCRDFLEMAKGNAPLLRLQAELEKERQDKAALTQRMEQLETALLGLQKPKAKAKAWGDEAGDMTAEEAAEAFQKAAPEVAPRKRGRPPKAAEAT